MHTDENGHCTDTTHGTVIVLGSDTTNSRVQATLLGVKTHVAFGTSEAAAVQSLLELLAYRGHSGDVNDYTIDHVA